MDDTDVFLFQFFDNLEERLDFVERQGTGRLVEDQDFNVPHESAEQLDQLLFRDRKACRLTPYVDSPSQMGDERDEPFMQFLPFVRKSHEDVFFDAHMGK